MKDTTGVFLAIKGFFRQLIHRIGALSFWKMAFVCFLLRVFVWFPLGATLALIVGCIWVWWNAAAIAAFLQKSRS